MPTTDTFRSQAFKTIIWLGLLTGTLDAIAAMLLSYNVSPAIIFKFIASGYFGQAAFAGGTEMVIAGLAFHYLITFIFTFFLYLAYPFTYRIADNNKYVVAVVYGGLTWVVMNMMIIPLTKIGEHPIPAFTIVKGVLALILCIGLPVALVADKNLKNNG
jgi:uncharacterized membrane protein YagU involved in acid resistance